MNEVAYSLLNLLIECLFVLGVDDKIGLILEPRTQMLKEL